MKKQYVIAFGEVESEHMNTVLLNKTTMVVICLLLLGLLSLSVYITARGFHRLHTDYRLSALNKENRVLEHSYQTLNQRMQNMESHIEDLKKRHQNICTAAAMPAVDVEYGVGGPESRSKMPHDEHKKIIHASINLTQLEMDIEHLGYSMDRLETMISTKVQQIAHYPSIRPVRSGWISSVFGTRIDPFTGRSEDHPGIDISIKPGSEVCATGAGIVKRINTRVTTNKGYGKYIIIDHAYGYETLYGHLSKIFVRKGQRVKRWDIIGLTGNTGKSTAPHLHYGVSVGGKSQNPFDFIL